MAIILYIPLDERPCNVIYPQHLVGTRDDVQLIIPPKQFLGNKKQAADVDKIWGFVWKNINKVDGVVLSAEMLIYGGLLPSRLHHLTAEERKSRIDMFRKLRELYPLIPIYVSNLIMRTPKFSTSDEEPDYYAQYGRELFRRAYLQDKKDRTGINDQEKNELKQASAAIPSAYIQDYEFRREFNRQVNLQLLGLVDEGIIDFLSIPQDDASIFGYTAKDQSIVYRFIEENRLQQKVMVYPGADEVGDTLLARMLNKLLSQKPLIYYFYSSTNGPYIVPLYEDRPMHESVKAHVLASGCQVTEKPEEADFILAINAPGFVMEEASNQKHKDVTYSSYRHLGYFAQQICDWAQLDKPVVLADSAFANGGDLELISYLDDYNVLDELISYKGWNTNGNTLGTSIAAGVFGYENQCPLEIQNNLLYHIFDDAFYQSKVRKEITDTLLPTLDGNYFDLNNQDHIVQKEIKKNILLEYRTTIKNSFKNITLSQFNLFCPWSRMFEIEIDLWLVKK
ncbi:DUF4127 family protein [Virgibacillus sp. NKC19-3]|uniref:DUF4127 family protein n=1 Tax=Virgibacillus saliphilus TaxID=2831674 RepID=UPI001C9BB8A9|nr:DUF4127 family protein [Virgibacillus sp. NKC19-3]MBY7144483.1 DUF4127 family protein [Virgibacillus sp. NKC19-3]